MKIRVCDADDGGVSKQFQVPDGTTVQGYIDRKKPNFTPDAYSVRLNNSPVADFGETTLKEGDTLTFSRSKLAGAGN